MSGQFTTRRHARFESLEQRQLLAGDVVVSVAQGILVVQGDELDNHIAITAGAEAGSFVVTGLEGTTVHLESQAATGSVTVSDVWGGARIDLGEGNDTLEMADADFRGSVSIRTGLGDDNVMIGAEANGGGEAPDGVVDEEASVAVHGSLRISTDGGEDHVAVDSATVRGFLDIDVGTENDTVSLGSLTDVAGVGAIGSSNGVGEDGVEDDARLHVRGGVHVDLGDGNDLLDLHHVSAHFGAGVHAGAGDDTVNASLSRLLALNVLGEDGADHITIDRLNARFMSVHTGSGNDNVEVIDSAFSLLSVNLGSGDDVLATTDVEAKLAILLGGLGQDTLNQLGVDDFVHDMINGFELPESIVSPIGRPPFGILPPFGGGIGHRI